MKRVPSTRSVVYIGVVLASALISLYKSLANDIINSDGILYVDIARVFSSDGLAGAFQHFKLPLYGILIDLMHKLTGLSYENSAYLINAVLLIIVSVAFVRIYEEISGERGRICVAAVLVLSLPVLNDYRDMVIRGYGFWAFMLLAVFYFIRYSKRPEILTAVKWQLAAMIATLFRIEGAAFLVLAPGYFVFQGGGLNQVARHLLRLNSLNIVLLFGFLVVAFSTSVFSGVGESTTLQLWMSYASPVSLVNALNAEAEALHAQLQYLSSTGEARIILVTGLVALVAVKVAKKAVLVYLAVWAYGHSRKWFRLEKESYVVLFFVCIGVLTLVGLAGNRFFLSSRYTVFTVLLLSLITFQYIDFLFRKLAQDRRWWWSGLAGFVVFVLFLDGLLTMGASKENIKLAGEWASQEVATGQTMACNELRLSFYSDRKCDFEWFDEPPGDEISKLKELGYDYLLLWVDRRHEQVISVIEEDADLVLIKEFPNRRGDSVKIFRVTG